MDIDIPINVRTRALILRYEHDRPITEDAARDALKQRGVEGDRDVVAVVLHPFEPHTRIRTRPEQDWSAAFDENERFAEALSRKERELGVDLDIHLFGCAPLMLMLHLASCLPRRPLYVYQQRITDGTWLLGYDRSLSSAQTPFFALEGLPTSRQGGRGKVALIVEVTQSIRDVALAEFQARHPSELLATVVLRPARGGPSPQAVQSLQDASEAAEQFRSVMDTLHKHLEGVESVLLAMDGPASLAAALGSVINTNTQHPVVLHHFNPEQRKYLAVRRIHPPRRVASTPGSPSSEQFAEAGELLKRVRTIHAQLCDWLKRPKQKSLRQKLEQTSLLQSDIDTVPARQNAPLFRHLNGSWTFHVNLLLGYRQLQERLRSPEDWEECVRLLLVHEAFHVAQQGATSYDYQGSGRTGFVLEALDFDADALAVEAALAWRTDHRPGRARGRTRTQDMEDIAWNVLESFRVFEPERPMRMLSERRLRRYLIWLFHACRLGTLPLRDAEPGALKRVVIEIAGLPTGLDPHEDYPQPGVRLDGQEKNESLVLALYFEARFARMQNPGWVRELLSCLAQWEQHPREEIRKRLTVLFERFFNQHRELVARP
ncbi:SAVED domain-containing protein [Archangium primigenium]|uniref:SAVED domain-containing protein n=1 Tax=[Archangium] primigenium TaxID=2792470 RepID=UPI00195AC912|nr:SAVED domain-containing protein [Archangium primigenium]MBM7117718.1 SAVED domain-containing protein [Archangium primigenium]